MEENSSKQQKKLDAEHLTNIVIFLIGVIAVVVGVNNPLKDSQSQTILISVGSSIIASAIVAGLSSIYIKSYRNAKELTETWGIASIEDKRTIMNIRINEQLGKTKTKYDIMAYGLKSLRESNTEAVEEALKRGAKMRIITVDPNLPNLSLRDREENKTEGSTADSIKRLLAWTNNLKEHFPNQCEVRISSFLPAQFYCREDDHIYVGPYQYGKESQQVITTEYRKHGNGFDYYEKYFESLWKDTDYCRKCDEVTI